MPMVIPSIYDDGSGSRMPFDGNMFSNMELRLGQIVAVNEIDDSNNMNKRVREYQAVVQHRSNGTGNVKTMDHLTTMSLFGNKVDYFDYTLRPDEDKLNIGSQVLILCINAESLNGVIIGSIRSDQSFKDDPTIDAPHLKFRFNGVDFIINSDGELTLTTMGATSAKGDVASPINTIIKIDKDQNITVTATKSVVVNAAQVMLGSGDLNAQEHGVLIGKGIDSFTGNTYSVLMNTSKNVMAKE